MSKLMKPKDVARQLNITPRQAAKHANEIEEADLHTFNRTPLGSVLFEENEIEMLRDYDEIKMFFDKKAEAQEIFKEKLMSQEVEPSEPEWFKYLANAKKQSTR